MFRWGISVFSEAGEKHFLLDTGTSGIVVPNADRLGIDLKKTEVLVLIPLRMTDCIALSLLRMIKYRFLQRSRPKKHNSVQSPVFKFNI